MKSHPLDTWQGPPPEPDTEQWDALVLLLSRHHGRAICGCRKSRNSVRAGFPCEGHVVTGSGMAGKRCRMHGGTQPVGIANVNYRHGGTSRYAMRGRLSGPYAENLGDMDYISLRDDLAVNATLIQAEIDIMCADPPQLLDPLLFDKDDVQQRQQEIMLFQVEQSSARQRYRGLVQDRNRMSRTEVARVRLAEDTVSGQQVKQFSQLVLDRVRVQVQALAARHRLPYETVAECLAAVQDDVWNIVAATQRSAGANDIPGEFQLSEF